MKKLYCFLTLFILSVMNTGCENKLDEAKPTDEVGVAQAFSSSESIRAVFFGLYRRLRQLRDEVLSNDDSEGYGALLNTRNVKGNDCVRPQFHWFVFEYRYLDNTNPTGRKTTHLWNGFYEIIGRTNIIIAEIEKSAISDEQKNSFIAEASAVRSFLYFDLIREYAHAYSCGTNNPGIPIYTEPSTKETEGKARASVEEVYVQIVSDLEFAVANIPEGRPDKGTINKNVAYGLLARVYLQMAEYTKAADAANKAKDGWLLDATSYANGFNDMDASPEWMWAMPQNNEQSIYFGGFGSFWDGTRYPRIYINSALVNTFSDTDVRKLFLAASDGGPYFATVKLIANDDFGEDNVLMRVAEMYLIEAESQAREGNDKEASDLLFALQENRDPMAKKSGNTGDDLIDEILLERRKELYGEMGVDYIDMRRLSKEGEKGLERNSDHHPAFRFSFSACSNAFIYKIPQGEIDANPNINEEDQN